MLPRLKVNEISNRQDVLARDVAGCLSARTPRSESWRQGEGSEYKKGWSTSREQGNRPQDDNRRRIREEPAQRPSALRMSGGSNAEKSDEVHSPMRKSSRVGGYNLPMKRTQQGSEHTSSPSRPETIQSEIGEWENSRQRGARKKSVVVISEMREPLPESPFALGGAEENPNEDHLNRLPQISARTQTTGKMQTKNFTATGTASVRLKAERFGDAFLSEGRMRNPRYSNAYPFHSWQTRCDSRPECRPFNAFQIEAASPRRPEGGFEQRHATAVHKQSVTEARRNQAAQEDHVCPYGREPQSAVEQASVKLQPISMVGAQGARSSISAKANRGWRWCNGVFRPKDDKQSLSLGQRT